MNILFLDQFSEIGGGQRVLLDVVDGALTRGWKAHVLVPGDGPLVEQLQARNVPVGHITCGPYRSGGKSPADFLRFALDIRQQVRVIDNLLRQDRYDLIYVNGPRLLSAATRVARGRAPVWFHAHSRIQQSYAVRAVGSDIRKLDATVVACSEWAAQPLWHYARPSRLLVIPNGTSDLGFRERLFADDATWTIGLVGRISPEKGQMEFLNAVALLKAEFPRARFVLCGAPAAPKYFSRIQALARDLNVELLGWREDIASIFSELDLLVVPSKEEAMGRVLVEAFAAGVPVVAFAVGGIPEVVTDGETGFLVDDATPESLAARIRQLLNGDAETLRRIARNGRQAWEERYTVAAFQQRITDLMAQAVSDWGAETLGDSHHCPKPRKY